MKSCRSFPGDPSHNRTILELKYETKSLSIYHRKYSQSDHTGIEIRSIDPYFSKANTHNRTILELKFGTGQHTLRQYLSQSDHTGIEMEVKKHNTTIAKHLTIGPYWN